MEKKKFYVLNWNFNSDSLIKYDILPYFRNCYNSLSKKDVPKTVDEWKEFIEKNGKYQFLCRCEYEIIITGWPQQKNDVKIDIWKQIEMNIEIIAKILMEEFNK